METKKFYQWERYWCPVNGVYSLADGGFLVDPESSLGKYYNSIAIKFHELPDTPCLVLLGEPGIGKTKTLEDAYQAHYAENQTGTAWVDLRSYTTDVGLRKGVESNPQVQNWLRGDYQLKLFLDSLDEGLLNVKTIAAILVEMISNWPLSKLMIRFACRTADWPKLLDSELCSLFKLKELPKFELLPLTRKNVKDAAIEEEINGDLFIKAIQDADATAFAIRPVTLNFLVYSYKKMGTLPTSKSEIYREGCLQLCEETNLSRIASKHTGNLTPTQRFTVASRIAAVMVFSNRYAIWTDTISTAPIEDTTIRELSGYSEEINGITFTVSETEIRDTLDTGLFSLRGEQRWGFSHYSYMEYLAANYLTKHNVPPTEIVRLISHQDKKIVPQLNGVATWLAALNSSVLEKLIAVQPNLLLRIDKETLPSNHRKKIIKKLLAEYQSGNQMGAFHLS
jgi:hypothetical protein